MGRNRVIGIDGGLPWHLPEDLARFKQLTMGRPLIMGRATFESIGRPLPGRTNIVVTRNVAYAHEGIVTASSPGEALVLALRVVATDDEIAVIGGGEIYRQFLPIASLLELTVVDDLPDGDTTFPEFDPEDWTMTEAPGAGRPGTTYRTYVRKTQERQAS